MLNLHSMMDYLYKREASALAREDWPALEKIRAKLLRMEGPFGDRPGVLPRICKCGHVHPRGWLGHRRENLRRRRMHHNVDRQAPLMDEGRKE